MNQTYIVEGSSRLGGQYSIVTINLILMMMCILRIKIGEGIKNRKHFHRLKYIEK